MATTDPAEFVLYDIDLSTPLAIMPFETSNMYLAISDIGSGMVKVPLSTKTAEFASFGKFVQINYRGGARGGFFIDNIAKFEAGDAEGGGRWMSLSGPGMLSYLQRAIVDDNGSVETTRHFPDLSKAEILITLLEEAQDRGSLAALTWDFTDTLDSDGNAWDDADGDDINVDTNLLEVVRKFSRLGFDFDIRFESGGFVLSAYKDSGLGEDISEDIVFRVGDNCEELHYDERGNKVINSYRVRFQGGVITVEDPTSISLYGRSEAGLNLRTAQSSASASTYATAALDITKNPRKGISIRVYDGVGPKLFVDYKMGDTVMLDNKGVLEAYRVLGIQADFNGRQYSNVVVEFNSLINELLADMDRTLEELLNDWNTAHDAGLLEARGWMAYNNTYAGLASIRALHKVGDYIYVGMQTSALRGILARYSVLTGEWTSLIGSFEGVVMCIESIGTDIYFGTWQVFGPFGCFHRYNTLTGAHTQPLGILGIDGSFDASQLTSMVAVGTDLYITGQFNQVEGIYDVHNVMKIDTTDFSYDTLDGGFEFPNGNIGWALEAHGGNVYLGYDGDVVGGVSAPFFAMWDGTAWNDVGITEIDNDVYAIKSDGSNLLIGGDFTGGIGEWDGTTFALLGGGTAGVVRAIEVNLSDVYVGGDFSDIGNNVAILSGGIWDGLSNGVNDTVRSLLFYNNNLYASGDFTVAGVDLGVKQTAIYYITFQALADQLQRNFNSYDLGEGIHGATATTSMASSDEIPLWQAASGLLRKITWNNMWLSIKTLIEAATLAFGGSSVNPFTGANTINQGASGASPGFFQTAFGSAVAAFHTFAKADGTSASPTNVKDGQPMGRTLRIRGYDGTSWSTTRAEVRAVADGDWDGSNNGVKYEIYATANGTTSLPSTPQVVILSSGELVLNSIKSGPDQTTAGAVAGEVWKTAGHSTLPDDVLMIGV